MPYRVFGLVERGTAAMSEITAASLSASVPKSILALKMQLQQERAVVALVEKALEQPQPAGGSTPSSGRLVDIVV